MHKRRERLVRLSCPVKAAASFQLENRNVDRLLEATLIATADPYKPLHSFGFVTPTFLIKSYAEVASGLNVRELEEHLLQSQRHKKLFKSRKLLPKTCSPRGRLLYYKCKDSAFSALKSRAIPAFEYQAWGPI